MKTLIIALLLCFSASVIKASFPYERFVNILNSGDGKSAKTAYHVYTIDEEYQLLEALKLNPQMQTLSIIDGQYYDILKVGDKEIYFKLVTKSKEKTI